MHLRADLGSHNKLKEVTMLRCLAVASGLMMGGLMFSAQQASAAPAVPAGQTPRADSLVEKAQAGYCRRWYRECRARWGGGHRFRRCMARHGC
ncbi:MAG: hypothetical protein K2X43_21265 [Hyphomonadaceae bacterium]|nr:hypothetical protein [Hyphomonadaceae bacterium]